MRTGDPCLTSLRDLIADLPSTKSDAHRYLDIQQRRLTDFIVATKDTERVSRACKAVTGLVDTAIRRGLIGS